MNTDTSNEPPDGGERKSFIRKILNWLPFSGPGTTEDLEHEIQELLEEGEEHGLITSLEEKMINSIFGFRETLAVEIMTPAAEIVSFEESGSVDELIQTMISHGFTRIPIYRENSDRVIGLVHVKDLLKVATCPQREQTELKEYIYPVCFISETKPIVDLLHDFQKRKAHMAMVTDEFGAVRGLITMEDILEEIVGEIDDEHDEDDQDKIEEVGGGAILIHARVDIEKIEERFDVEFPEGPYESIGGLLITVLGRLGRVGDIVESSGLRFEIKSANSRQIKIVLVSDVRGQQEK